MDQFRRVSVNDQTSNGGSFGDKLGREADLLLGGAWDGTGRALKNAVTDPSTLAKIGGAALVGSALTALEISQPELRPLKWIVGGALAFNFATDVAGKLGDIAQGMSDTWNSPQNFGKSKELVGDAIGNFAVDTGLMIVGGKLGNSMTERYLTGPEGGFVRIPTLKTEVKADGHFAPLYRKGDTLPSLYETSKDSIVAINKWVDPGQGTKSLSAGVGTGFFVSTDGKILTNAHVVSNEQNLVVTTAKGEKYWAKVLDIDHEHDLAMLYLARENPGKVFTPLRMADKAPERTDTVATIGYPHNGKWNSLFLSPGKFIEPTTTSDVMRTPFDPSLPYEKNVLIGHQLTTARVKLPEGKVLPEYAPSGSLVKFSPAPADAPSYYETGKNPAYELYSHTEGGNSGSPIMNLDGEVIGIATRGGGLTASFGTPVQYIRDFLSRQLYKPITRLPAEF